MRGERGVQPPLAHACGQPLQQPMLSQDVWRVRRGFEPGLSQGFVWRVDTGHLVLLVFVLIEDNQLHT